MADSRAWLGKTQDAPEAPVVPEGEDVRKKQKGHERSTGAQLEPPGAQSWKAMQGGKAHKATLAH